MFIYFKFGHPIIEKKMKYKERVSLEDRKKVSNRIVNEHPNRIPVIVECSEALQRDHTLPKNKFAVPYDLTLAQFMYVVRKNMALKPEFALYAFINNRLHPTAALMGTIYSQEKTDDGFMYIELFQESTFG